MVKPAVVYSGKMKTMTLKLAGKGHIPKSGVGGVVVLLSSKGQGQLHGGDCFGNNGGPRGDPRDVPCHHEDYPGATTVTTLGWYAKGLGDTGDLIHTQYVGSSVHVGKTISLHPVGVPLAATGALLEVITPNGPTKVGGALLPASQFSQFVLVPLMPAPRSPVKAAKGTIIAVHGWTAPVQAAGRRFTQSANGPELPGLIELTTSAGIPP